MSINKVESEAGPKLRGIHSRCVFPSYHLHPIAVNISEWNWETIYSSFDRRCLLRHYSGAFVNTVGHEKHYRIIKGSARVLRPLSMISVISCCSS